MAYEISLERDVDRGLDRYTIALREGFGPAHAHALGDWLTAAAQNPTATFAIDVSEAPAGSRRAVAMLLARCAWLRARRRVEVVAGRLAGHGAAGAGVAPFLWASSIATAARTSARAPRHARSLIRAACGLRKPAGTIAVRRRSRSDPSNP